MAPQRLGQQRPGPGRVVQRRRVELDELEVGHRDAGPQGHGDAVAGGLGRVGGDREQLAGAAGGQQDVAGPDLDGSSPAGGRPRHRRSGRARRAGRRRTVARRGPPRSAGPPRPAPARPRHRWRRPRRGPPGRSCGRPRGPGRGRRWASRSNAAPMAMSSLTRAGPSSTSTRTASTSHRSAPAPSVSARCRSVESGSPPSTAATPPWAQRVVAWCSSALVSTPTRRPWASAARTAADSPATPDPRTSRSSS